MTDFAKAMPLLARHALGNRPVGSDAPALAVHAGVDARAALGLRMGWPHEREPRGQRSQRDTHVHGTTLRAACSGMSGVEATRHTHAAPTP